MEAYRIPLLFGDSVYILLYNNVNKNRKNDKIYNGSVNTTSTPQADELCNPVSRGNPKRPESFANRTG